MLIGGLHRCSFIDFPGILSAVVFVHGCNLRCGYCHNPGLVEGKPAEKLTEEDVFAFLESRRGQLEGVVISGGEPTLQQGLPDFAARVRSLGFKVKLDTNGTRPEVLEELLGAELLDYVAMDLKDVPEQYPDFCGMRASPDRIRRSIDLILGSKIDHEFRTTVVEPHHDRARLDEMARAIEGAQRWVLQRFRPGEILDPKAAFQAPDPAFLQAVATETEKRRGLACSWR
jgi:pyruvate formate lyase activating enzyme